MPQLVTGRRRRGQGAPEMIAETVGKLINAQAARGWTYAGSDSYRTIERPRWWSRPEEVIYTVLLFERPTESEAAGPSRAAAAPPAPVYDPSAEPEALDDEALAAELATGPMAAAAAGPGFGAGRSAARRRLFDDHEAEGGGRESDNFDDRDYDRRAYGSAAESYEEPAFSDDRRHDRRYDDRRPSGRYEEPELEDGDYDDHDAGVDPRRAPRQGGDRPQFDDDRFAGAEFDDDEFADRAFPAEPGYGAPRFDDRRAGDPRFAGAGYDPRAYPAEGEYGEERPDAEAAPAHDDRAYDDRAYDDRAYDDRAYDDRAYDPHGFDERGYGGADRYEDDAVERGPGRLSGGGGRPRRAR